jgi:hypothetical protein
MLIRPPFCRPSARFSLVLVKNERVANVGSERRLLACQHLPRRFHRQARVDEPGATGVSPYVRRECAVSERWRKAPTCKQDGRYLDDARGKCLDECRYMIEIRLHVVLMHHVERSNTWPPPLAHLRLIPQHADPRHRCEVASLSPALGCDHRSPQYGEWEEEPTIGEVRASPARRSREPVARLQQGQRKRIERILARDLEAPSAFAADLANGNSYGTRSREPCGCRVDARLPRRGRWFDDSSFWDEDRSAHYCLQLDGWPRTPVNVRTSNV